MYGARAHRCTCIERHRCCDGRRFGFRGKKSVCFVVDGWFDPFGLASQRTTTDPALPSHPPSVHPWTRRYTPFLRGGGEWAWIRASPGRPGCLGFERVFDRCRRVSSSGRTREETGRIDRLPSHVGASYGWTGREWCRHTRVSRPLHRVVRRGRCLSGPGRFLGTAFGFVACPTAASSAATATDTRATSFPTASAARVQLLLRGASAPPGLSPGTLALAPGLVCPPSRIRGDRPGAIRSDPQAGSGRRCMPPFQGSDAIGDRPGTCGMETVVKGRRRPRTRGWRPW